MGAATVGYRSKRRVNGWDCPPHPFQFVAWFCVIYFTVGHFTTIVPALLSPWQPAAYIILGVVFVVQFVVHILAVTIDPSDPNILTAQKDTKRCVPTLDRTRHKHVIENMHCYLCEADVGPKSKHCSVCNKCVAHFDHHCKWLNNCVGSKNYRFFIATLVSCLAGLVILFALSLMQFIAYYTDKNHGNILQPYKDVVDAAESYSNVYAETTPHTLPHSGANFSISPAEETTVPGQNLEAVFKIMYIAVPDVGWQIWTGIYFVLALVGACLLAHLFSFHIYLMCKGFSTYDYIVLERERAEQTARDKEVEEGSVNRAKQKSQNKAVNRIAPQTADELELKSEQVTSRSAECFTGGRENAYAEDATPPSSVPTPPPPLRAHSPPFRQQNHIAPEHEWHHNHQASHTQQNKSQSTKTEQSSSGSKEDTVHKPKKKRKRKKRPSEFDMNNDLPPGYLVNHIPLPSTEIIPTFEDMQDLEAAIARTHPAQLDNDSGLGPGSLSDVAVAMQPKSATLPHNASNTKGTAAVWSRDSSDDDDTLGEQHSSMYSENSSPADMRRSASMLGLSGSPEKEIFPRVKVERLQLPNSSDSETEATRKPSKNDLVYKSRGYEARLQAVQPPFHMNTPGYNIQAAGPVAEYDSDSAESLREIPICDTRLGSLYCTSPRYKQSANGRNSVAKQRSTTGDQTLPRTRKKRRRAAKSTAVSSSGLSNCNLAYDSHGDSYTVVRDSPRSEPPKRHKDVPPLDLSSLGEDDGDLRKHVSQI